jgi:hypothetical protein
MQSRTSSNEILIAHLPTDVWDADNEKAFRAVAENAVRREATGISTVQTVEITFPEPWKILITTTGVGDQTIAHFAGFAAIKKLWDEIRHREGIR